MSCDNSYYNCEENINESFETTLRKMVVSVDGEPALRTNGSGGSSADADGNIVLRTELSYGGGFAGTFTNNYVNIYTASMAVRDDANIDGASITDFGSTAVDIIDITGLTTLNLNTNGSPDMYGKIRMSSTNATESISLISNGHDHYPITLGVETGLNVTLNIVAWTGVAANNEIVGDATYFSGFISMEEADTVTMERATVGGFNVWKITNVHIAQ
jgi:hypothetical protein